MNVTESELHGRALTPRLPPELVASPAFLLKRLGFAAKERGMEAYDRLGMTPYHYAILLTVDEGPPETQGAIAETLGYDKGQLVGMLDELEEQGLIERRRDPYDRRRHVVRVTAAGKRTLAKLRRINKKFEDELLKPLNQAERDQLQALLLRLAEVHLPGCAHLPSKTASVTSS